eukprot:2430943-Prymnesium_polylepis.1
MGVVTNDMHTRTPLRRQYFASEAGLVLHKEGGDRYDGDERVVERLPGNKVSDRNVRRQESPLAPQRMRPEPVQSLERARSHRERAGRLKQGTWTNASGGWQPALSARATPSIAD